MGQILHKTFRMLLSMLLERRNYIMKKYVNLTTLQQL